MENYLSMAARNAGRADEAIRLARRARERFRALGIPALERAMDDNLSALLLDRGAPGDAATALEMSRASLAHELAAGKRQFAVVSRLNVARALSALARHDEALAEIAAAIAEAERIPYEAALPELHATQLEIANAAGRWPLVAAAARGALAAAARVQDREREQLVAEMEARYRALEQQREIDRLGQQGRLRELELAAAQGDLRRQRLLLGSAAVAGASLAGASALLVALLRAGRRREQELDRITRTDALTGAASRRAFLAALDGAFEAWRRSGTPATLVLLDADHFKAINDRYGHPVGDRALIGLVERARGQVREGDLVGRLGGEEFALLLCGLGRAEAVRAAIAAATYPLAGEAVRLTASLGVAALDDGYPDAERWLTAADDALYEAKQAGRDRVAVAAN
jgi:diguanylate cyclase (GGDEF)-like protein